MGWGEWGRHQVMSNENGVTSCLVCFHSLLVMFRNCWSEVGKHSVIFMSQFLVRDATLLVHSFGE